MLTTFNIRGIRMQDNICFTVGLLIQKVQASATVARNVMNQEDSVLPLLIFWLGKQATSMQVGMPDNVLI